MYDRRNEVVDVRKKYLELVRQRLSFAEILSTRPLGPRSAYLQVKRTVAPWVLKCVKRLKTGVYGYITVIVLWVWLTAIMRKLTKLTMDVLLVAKPRSQKEKRGGKERERERRVGGRDSEREAESELERGRESRSGRGSERDGEKGRESK